MTKNKKYLMAMFLSALMTPMLASATTMQEYADAYSPNVAQDKSALILKAEIDKEISDAKDPITHQDTELSLAIKAYFKNPPSPQNINQNATKIPQGVIDFGAVYSQLLQASKAGQDNLNNYTVRDILDFVIVHDIKPQLAKKNPKLQPSPTASTSTGPK